MTATIPWDVVVEPRRSLRRDVVVEHSADPDYWTVYVTGHDGLIYDSTLATTDVAHLRDVDHVQITDRRTGEPWSVR
jgi:hypothetical protein